MKIYLAIPALLIALSVGAQITKQQHEIGADDVREAHEYCSAKYDTGDPDFHHCMAEQLRK